MSVDYLICGICGETFGDCVLYYTCVNCESHICNYCYAGQVEKHGIIGDEHEKNNWYGEDALNKCDFCIKEESDKKLSDEIMAILYHAKIFIGTREKMHPDGIKLYTDALHNLKEFVNG